MGCRTQGYRFDLCDGFNRNLEHCYYYTAPSGTGVTFEYTEYPQSEIRKNGGYNIPGRETDRVMYGSNGIEYEAEFGPGSGPSCGKITLANPCPVNIFARDNFDTSIITLDYTPRELSFDYQYSDTWFSYLYDTSNEAGHIGIACYYLEQRQQDTTTSTEGTPASGTEGEPGYDPGTPGTSSTASRYGTVCHPCTAFTCSPGKTMVRYDAGEDLTGDPDCPHPTLFGIGTDSLKIVFSYNAFSSQLPDGVLDFEASYDGVTYTDIWNEGNLQGIEYVSTQNPWQSGDESFSDFQIYDINDGVNAVNFRVKFRIEPIFDDTTTPTTFTGTRWVVTELLDNGTGFSVGDIYPISFTHRHPDNSFSNLTLNLKITSVGPIQTLSGNLSQDILRAGDTINGHTITRAFHTEVGKYPYHIAYLDGSGSNFVKDTQYTSNRDHVITVKAGFGIPDRAILVGSYQFLQKSVQFMTGDVNQNAPDVLNDIEKPLAFVSVNQNGQITDINVSSGAYSLNQGSLFSLNSKSVLAGYSPGTGISTSGGSGSGLTVDIIQQTDVDNNGNVVTDTIGSVEVNTSGSGYQVGDIVTISGGSAKIEISQVTHGGRNLNKLGENPELGVSAPADNDTGLSKISTDDGEPQFILKTDGGDINFEIVTKDGNPNVEPIDPTNGGNNRQATIRTRITGGVITSVDIIDKGAGYSVEKRPQLILSNQYEETEDQTPNGGYREDLVDEFNGILRSLPEGKLQATTEDFNAIEESYGYVPKTRSHPQKQPAMEIKLDIDRERVHQVSQYKYRPEATEPLKSIIVPEYDVTYLDDVDLDSDYKSVIRDDKQRAKDTVNKNIADITQERIPDTRRYDESKVESVVGSLTDLPTASQFTKYLIRQYRPDSSKETNITVSLSCTPVDIGCDHFTCDPPPATPGTSTSSTDPNTGVTTTITNTYTMFPTLSGPGCHEWNVSGTMKIWHDLSRSAAMVAKAAAAYGNPF